MTRPSNLFGVSQARCCCNWDSQLTNSLRTESLCSSGFWHISKREKNPSVRQERKLNFHSARLRSVPHFRMQIPTRMEFSFSPLLMTREKVLIRRLCMQNQFLKRFPHSITNCVWLSDQIAFSIWFLTAFDTCQLLRSRKIYAKSESASQLYHFRNPSNKQFEIHENSKRRKTETK